MTSSGSLWQRARELYVARSEPESVRVLAEGAWRVLLFLTLVGVIAVIVYAVSVFSTVIENLGSSAQGSSRAPEVLNRSALDQTMRAIQERAGGVSISPTSL